MTACKGSRWAHRVMGSEPGETKGSGACTGHSASGRVAVAGCTGLLTPSQGSGIHTAPPSWSVFPWTFSQIISSPNDGSSSRPGHSSLPFTQQTLSMSHSMDAHSLAGDPHVAVRLHSGRWPQLSNPKASRSVNKTQSFTRPSQKGLKGNQLNPHFIDREGQGLATECRTQGRKTGAISQALSACHSPFSFLPQTTVPRLCFPTCKMRGLGFIVAKVFFSPFWVLAFCN